MKCTTARIRDLGFRTDLKMHKRRNDSCKAKPSCTRSERMNMLFSLYTVMLLALKTGCIWLEIAINNEDLHIEAKSDCS
jgi:hypothetical protein